MNETRIAFAAALAVVMGFVGATAQAAPVIDGKVLGGGEGYQYMSQIVPSKDMDKIPPADVFFFQDPHTYDLTVGVVMPLEYVDNTYGTSGTKPATHTHFTWEKNNIYTNSSDKLHTFSQLVGSDHASFTIAKPGSTTSSFTLDYISPDTNGIYIGSTNLDTGKDDNGVVASIATSLQYDLNTIALLTSESPELTYADTSNPGKTEYTTADPGLSGWIFNVTYEFTIDGSFFNNMSVLSDAGFINGFSLNFDELHASPSKAGEFKNVVPGTFVKLVPTPTAGAMGLILMGGLLGRRRRRA